MPAPNPPDAVDVVERVIVPSVAWTVAPGTPAPLCVTRPVTFPSAEVSVTVTGAGGPESVSVTGTLAEVYPVLVNVSVTDPVARPGQRERPHRPRRQGRGGHGVRRPARGHGHATDPGAARVDDAARDGPRAAGEHHPQVGALLAGPEVDDDRLRAEPLSW